MEDQRPTCQQYRFCSEQACANCSVRSKLTKFEYVLEGPCMAGSGPGGLWMVAGDPK